MIRIRCFIGRFGGDLHGGCSPEKVMAILLAQMEMLGLPLVSMYTNTMKGYPPTSPEVNIC